MAATIIEWSGFLHSTNSLCFSSARRYYCIYTPGFGENATAVVTRE